LLVLDTSRYPIPRIPVTRFSGGAESLQQQQQQVQSGEGGLPDDYQEGGELDEADLQSSEHPDDADYNQAEGTEDSYDDIDQLVRL
jgi:hypothetical protein